jgi:hypothetical protein
MRLMQYANGIRDASNPPQIAVLNPPTQVFGRTIFGSHTPNVFTQQPSQLADHHYGFGHAIMPPPFGVAASNAIMPPPFGVAASNAIMPPPFGVAASNAIMPPPFGVAASGAAAARAASSHQHLADEGLALQLQHELWAQDNAGQSVPRAAAPLRNVPHYPDGEQQSVLSRRLPGRRSSRPPAAVDAPNPQIMPSMSQIRPFGAPVPPAADLPPHVAPILIAEAIKQKQQCSISLDDISTENACITTCAHIFSKDSIKEWLSRDSTCPECRKPCRINGEPAAAPAHASHQPVPRFGQFGFGAGIFVQEQHQAAGVPF